MNIIFVSGRLAKARTITLGPKHIAVATASVLFAVLLTSGLLNFAMLRYAVNDLRMFFDNDLRFLAQFNRG